MNLNRKVLVGCLIFCAVVILLYATTITIMFALRSCESENKIKCETYGCVQVAAQIVSYINESIDPCDNFYHFANGQYINEMLDDTEDWDSLSFYSTATKMTNKKIGPRLMEPLQSNGWKPFELAKRFYRSCLNQSTLVKRGNHQLLEILQTLGGWPVVQGKSWLRRKFDLIELIRKVRDLGFETNFLFDLDIHFDLANRTNRYLRISKGSYEHHEDNDTDYQNVMLKTPTYFVNLNDTKAKTRIEMDMLEVWQFEQELIKSNEQENDTLIESLIKTLESLEENGDQDSYYSVTTIKELQEKYPYLNWLDYVNAILPAELMLFTFEVTDNEVIIDCDSRFFENLGSILKSTSNRTLANYIVWRAIYSLYQMETNKIVTLLYSRKYFNQTTREAVVNLVEDVRHAFIDMLRNITWMNSETRSTAIEKAENIVAHVGYYPSGMIENEEIEEYYNDLVMESDNFLRNSLQWNLFTNNRRFQSLRKVVSRSGWEATMNIKPNEANAFYNPSDNTIKFPIAILNEKFFVVDRPRYINYATLGNTVGHEITHGFDSDGGDYDLIGDSVTWWNSETQSEFKEKSNCFVEQYSRYTDSQTKLTVSDNCVKIQRPTTEVIDSSVRQVDGAKTLDENIADNGGIRAAYHAYQKWVERNGPEKLVPGIKYNQNQLFWISYAQAEGGVFGDDYLESLITDEKNVHAPDEFRVNGAVSNAREFAADFNCLVGTRMSPEKICKIW